MIERTTGVGTRFVGWSREDSENRLLNATFPSSSSSFLLSIYRVGSAISSRLAGMSSETIKGDWLELQHRVRKGTRRERRDRENAVHSSLSFVAMVFHRQS
jgi:hypothetical protein